MGKMTQIKELHLAKRLEDLQKHSIIPDAGSKQTHNLLETAKKLLIQGENFHREGDEELAYVYYMRYFNLLACIHKKPDYFEHKASVRILLGGNTTNRITMDKLELLSMSLNERYSRLNDKKQEASGKKPTTALTPVNTMGRDYNELSASEKFDLLKATTTSQTTVSVKNEMAPSLHPVNLITCEELFSRIRGQNVLIMDCRSSKDYEMSHLTYAWSFNVPEEFIARGMSAGRLQDKLDSSSKASWSARSIKDHVVLMDWSTKDSDPPEDSPIAILRDILQNWDVDVVYRSPIKILEGGYELFIMMYPAMSSNPTVQAPTQNGSDSSDLIDDIEYPSIHDITMKDEIREHAYAMRPGSCPRSPTMPRKPLRPPNIDRSSKLAALKKYDEKKPITEIIKEQNDLLEKAQANDEQLQQTSEKWQSLIELKRKGAEENDLTADEQRLWYHLMQLESQAEDYKIENIRLRDELEKYKKLERDQQEKMSPTEVESLEETTKTIESKIMERQKLDEQHERERMQREKFLALARENKRHLKEPADENEEISKPKIPQFDRSAKPQIASAFAPSTPNYTTVAERQRDFSPVPGAIGRGLTGLKNLGNTCYMNSILQCLSNTPQLTEYCITDKYKKFISRNNKTKGHIVEEVAALIKVLWNGNYKCVASKDLRYVIGQYQQIFRGIEQQDSHEFLTILMDWLHSDLQTLQAPEKPPANASEKAWLEFTKSKESIILRLFYGQIKSTVKCVQCNKESATYESFSNLSLELPSNGNVCQLDVCMDMYFSGEPIHGWNCPNCKQKRDAVKKLDISKLPPVLVIHLKRFHADQDGIGSSYKKKQNYVRFPLENLDMTPYIAKSESRSGTPKTYQLYGVSNHYGSMESGHYTAFCKSGNYGRWFKFDDQVVTSLDTSNVVSSAAYILFYTWLPPMQIPDIR